jgi:hypothetical protein
MIILPANTLSTGGYEIANSCRFNDGDSAYMHKTCSSAFDTDRWTISIWFKRGNLGLNTRLISCDNDDGSNDDYIRFDDADQMEFMIYEGSSIVGLLKPNMVFRDVSAWYHLVCVWDSANGTAGNRMRMYVNGTEVTSFETDTNPSEGVNASWGNTSHPIEVGRRGSNGTQYFDGYIAEVAVCDGQAYAASDFGEFDEDSPTIWKPKDVSGLTFGTSGFYLDFEASGNLGNDANGGTDLTEVNLAATDQATDTPTNNFCTMNPLNVPASNQPIFSEGNLQAISISGAGSFGGSSTFAVSSGKWYLEAKALNANSSVGISYNSGETARTNNDGTDSSYEWIYKYNGTLGHGTDSSYGDTFTTNDIIGIALNLDDDELIFYKNGTAQASGAAIDITASQEYVIYHQDDTESGSNQSSFAFNFGSPPYANTSDAADANGYGAFEYAPPSGYFALCTKNLAEYG